MTLAIVESSSGAASASAMNPAIVSGVAGRMSIPPTMVPTSWSRYWNLVATPKLPPPPRIAQNRSGWVLGIDAEELAVRGHDIGGEQVVDREPVLAAEVPDPPAEGDPAQPDRAGVPEPGGQAVGPDRRRVLARGQTRLRPGRAACDVDVDGLHVREVEHDGTVDDAVTGGAMATAADGQLEAGLAGERDDGLDVARVGDLDDDRRPGVDAAEEGGPGRVVVGVVGRDHPPADLRAELRDRDGSGKAGVDAGHW